MPIVEAIVPQKVTDARTVVAEGTADREGRIRKAGLCHPPGVLQSLSFDGTCRGVSSHRCDSMGDRFERFASFGAKGRRGRVPIWEFAAREGVRRAITRQGSTKISDFQR